jgi:hypothetical protein
MPRTTFLLLALAAFAAPAAAQDGRTKSRLLFSFENAGETARLLKSSENSTLSVSQDNGVTHGKNCARWVVKRGADFGVLELDAVARKDWRDFDYLAIDVYLETKQPDRLVLELWDKLSKNYATRCTFEEVKLRPGRQTLLYPIGRPRRNGKEGREWHELQPQDKIDLGNLTRVKFFLTPPKDQDAVLWIDNVRLLQEDAAKPKIKLPLPQGRRRHQVRQRRREAARLPHRRAVGILRGQERRVRFRQGAVARRPRLARRADGHVRHRRAGAGVYLPHARPQGRVSRPALRRAGPASEAEQPHLPAATE